jgi:hypothetical protein
MPVLEKDTGPKRVAGLEGIVPADPLLMVNPSGSVMPGLGQQGSTRRGGHMQTRVTRLADGFEQLEINTRNDADWDAPTEDLVIPESQRRTLMQLNDHTCRWPVGDPARPRFFFCGGATETGQAYCHAHCLRASNVAPLAPNRSGSRRYRVTSIPVRPSVAP